jgi:hypothetical protein
VAVKTDIRAASKDLLHKVVKNDVINVKKHGQHNVTDSAKNAKEI